MRAEIQKADPVERRKLILVCFTAALAGAVLLYACDMLFSRAAGDTETAIHRVYILVGALYVPALAIIVLCKKIWETGRDTIGARRYPPPGMKVIRDTVVVTGAEAKRRGNLLQLFSIVFGALSLVIPIVLWFIVWKLTNAS